MGKMIEEEGIDAAFAGMVQDLQQQVADKWAFWKRVVDKEEGVIYQQVEPVLMKPAGMVNKRDQILILKCKDAVTRFEMQRESAMLLDKLSAELEAETGGKKRIVKIVLR